MRLGFLFDAAFIIQTLTKPKVQTTHGRTVCTFFGKSPLSSHKTTLKQQINGQKRLKMKEKDILFWQFSFQLARCSRLQRFKRKPHGSRTFRSHFGPHSSGTISHTHRSGTRTRRLFSLVLQSKLSQSEDKSQMTELTRPGW